MESFQKIILIIAVIILTITLVFIGVVLSYSKNRNTWPPIIPECPDYWSMDLSNNCINTKDLGTCPPQSGQKHLKMDFNSPTYSGYNGLCAKYKWANNCKVSWDGITYGGSNPCTKLS